jgi:hypothetical protein
MIAQQFHGVSAEIDLTISDRAVNYKSVVNMTMELTESLHDYLCIEIAGIPPRAIKDYYDGPVHLKVSYGARYVQHFHGKIETVEPVSKAADGYTNASPFQSAKLHCYGTSYKMRTEKNRIWERTSLTDMARELADTYGFSLDVPKLPIVYKRVVQQGESDWQVLVRIVTDHGLRVNVHGTHMHIYDPQNAYSRNTSFHRIRSISEYGPRQAPGKLIEMKGAFGRSVKDGSFYDLVVPVMEDNGTYYDIRSSEVTGKSGAVLEKRLLDTVDTYGEAKNLIRAAVNKDYDFNAEIMCQGLAGCVPGGVVELDKMHGGFDGNWYVKSVKHTVNTSAFLTTVEVARDSESDLPLTSTTTFTRPPVAVLNTDDWQAKRKTVREYA